MIPTLKEDVNLSSCPSASTKMFIVQDYQLYQEEQNWPRSKDLEWNIQLKDLFFSKLLGVLSWNAQSVTHVPYIAFIGTLVLKIGITSTIQFPMT